MTKKVLPDIIKEISRKLRKEMTQAEKILWEKLRAKRLKNTKFLKQSPLCVLTEYSWLDRFIIPDFLCREYKLIIELDWSVHNLKEVYELDRYKEELLERLGYTVLRFKNEEIFDDLERVLEEIEKYIWN